MSTTGLTEACSAFSRDEQESSLADTDQTFLDREFEIGALISSLRDNVKRAARLIELPSHGEDSMAGGCAYDTGRELGQMFVGATLLGPRERAILELIAQGQSNKEIARELGITPETVKSHVKKSLPSWRSTSERKRSRVLVQLLATAINRRFQRKCSAHRCAISLRNGDVSCLVSFVTACRSLTLPLASAGERTDARLKTHEMRERDGEIQVC